MGYRLGMEAENWISLTVALVALGFSGWQAWTAHTSKNEQLALARRIHREQNEPYVVVDIGSDRPGSSLLVLSIENTGPTMARDVRIQVAPDLVSSHDHLTERLQRAVASTIPVLPPGRRLTFAFDVYGRREEKSLPMQFDFTVDAKGPAGPVEPLTYRVDLNMLQGVLIGESPTKPLEEALGSISTAVEGLTRKYERANSEALRAETERRATAFRHQARGTSDGA
jgi:hypothetical protein